jgi:alpha-beta hydrolase superfamily lysophospholipase
MKKEILSIDGIPAILWGEESESIYIYVHGKMSSKDDAQGFAEIATQRGFQVLSFDLPEHGERKNENYPCMAWNGVHDLGIVGNYAKRNWNEICLYGNSLGAYFSLLAYKDYSIKKCLFLSPVLNMERLMQNMMKWFDINERMLKKQGKISTPMGEILCWDYYCYVKENPITKWDIPTAILYGSEDNLTERETVETFTKLFNCDLTILEGSEHWFHTERQLAFHNEWLYKHIS